MKLFIIKKCHQATFWTIVKILFYKNKFRHYQKNVLKKYQFNPVYNIIGDYDLILKIAERYKGMGFQKNF